jgi:hydrogenase expression/formation protein HypC
MCIAIPMRVLATDGGFAHCEGRGQARRVSLALVGEVAVDSWLLVHVDTAREVIDAQRAAQVNDALDALERAMNGGNVDGLFADLVGREPELPAHLRGAGEA